MTEALYNLGLAINARREGIMTLDGSSIKAAREAKGMTQAELAGEVGVAQQTIDKIESGKMKRTTYLPEINRALGGGQTSAIQVLRTILCANPTAEQIMAALEANGLAIVPKSDGPLVDLEEGSAVPVSMADVASLLGDPVRYVRDVIARRNISASKLAETVGISPSTLNRALNDPNHTCILSTRTLRKIKEWDNGKVHSL
jgi:transcriptional regulator with XRE-family HTH domain